MITYILIGAIAVGIGGMVFAASLLLQGNNDQLEDRLASLTQNSGRGATKTNTPKPNLLLSPLDAAPNKIEELVNKFLNLRVFLEQTGKDISISKFVLMTGVIGGFAGLLCAVFSPWKSLAPLAAIICGTIPFVFCWFIRGRRLNKFGQQLPAALDLMCQALRAGQSLPAAIQLVGQQISEPLGPEFARSFEEQNLGVTLPDSLKTMTDRVPNLDLRFFVTAVVLQRQTGGDLAEILEKISHLTRERFQIRGQIQALTGEGRISGIVLLVLPPALFAVMLQLNYDYVMLLFEDPMGKKMLLVAIVLQFIGAAAIKKIIDIKV
ncbi:MAG: type II secretion system F family protein [Mariniblastus sp.]|nr:type II secretion system F family protein [Mariniblastus sp.]